MTKEDLVSGKRRKLTRKRTLTGKERFSFNKLYLTRLLENTVVCLVKVSEPILLMKTYNTAVAANSRRWFNQDNVDTSLYSLLVPYRIADGHFSAGDQTKIKDTMDGMAKYMSDCIVWYDDTETQSK